MTVPKLISVDDHVIEPAHVWQDNLPASLRDRGPKLIRRRGILEFTYRTYKLNEDDSAPWADCWAYEDTLFPIDNNLAAISFDRDKLQKRACLYEELLPGCYDRSARLHDLDVNHTEASMCFPTFPRFCGQTFLEAADRELAAACVRAYNDWMIDDWCADEAYGRLIPLTLIPLWDAELAAAEVRRCADKGSHAICFSEAPQDLDLPSIFTDFWDPLWQACNDTQTVVNMHIGSSSKFRQTSSDAPILVTLGLTYEGASRAMIDWLCSGVLARFPDLKICLSEGQAGWIPFVLERLDHAWDHARAYAGVGDRVKNPPSSYVPGRVYSCIFDDYAGLALRDQIGMGQIMFETDYPHGDSTWPNSADVATRLAQKAGLSEDETWRLLRGNAIECYGLQRWGITS